MSSGVSRPHEEWPQNPREPVLPHTAPSVCPVPQEKGLNTGGSCIVALCKVSFGPW